MFGGPFPTSNNTLEKQSLRQNFSNGRKAFCRTNPLQATAMVWCTILNWLSRSRLLCLRCITIRRYFCVPIYRRFPRLHQAHVGRWNDWTLWFRNRSNQLRQPSAKGQMAGRSLFLGGSVKAFPAYLLPNRSNNFPCIPPNPPLLNTHTISPPWMFFETWFTMASTSGKYAAVFPKALMSCMSFSGLSRSPAASCSRRATSATTTASASAKEAASSS